MDIVNNKYINKNLTKIITNIRSETFYKNNQYVIILIYFVLLFILDYSGVMQLYDQNYIRRIINLFRRRDELTYKKN